METTPDTLNYMILGYAAFTVIMVTYLVSLYLRWRNLKNEYLAGTTLHVLDEIAKK